MTSVWVYKTDVDEVVEANKIMEIINRKFPAWDVSFDLEDCDKVLRIESHNGVIDENEIINILEKFGHQIEQLL